MPLSKLSIFSKDTDATEAVKGYEYQKLRTLETWLKNKVDNVDEALFCEYEDDIFQRNIAEGTAKFTQIKLYSSKSFSFKSEEVTKAIANFFRLFVKGEYSFDQQQFFFETNTTIAAKYVDNDAELLKEWFENQNNMSPELLANCSKKIKSIVTAYIKKEFPKVEKNQKSKAQSTMIDFNNLPSTVWEDFAKSIKWIFNNEDAAIAVEKTINNIKALINQLPFSNLIEKAGSVFTTLYYEVSEKMFKDDAADRCLTLQRIDSLLLDLGDDADKQYNLAYIAWTDVIGVVHFRLAEFLEVLHAATHCRQNNKLEHHTAFWKKLLLFYMEMETIPLAYKLDATNEFLWLSFRPQLQKNANRNT